MDEKSEKFIRIEKVVKNIKLAQLLTYILSLDKGNRADLIVDYVVKLLAIDDILFNQLLTDAQKKGLIVFYTATPNDLIYNKQDLDDRFNGKIDMAYYLSHSVTQIVIDPNLINI